jgi:WD40 repeat protein
MLAAGGVGRTLILWDVANKEPRAIFPPQNAGVESLAFAPDGRTLVSGGADGTLKLWNVATRQEVAQWQGHAGPVHAIAFSSDGRLLATGGDTDRGGCEIVLWRADAPASGSVSPNDSLCSIGR